MAKNTLTRRTFLGGLGAIPFAKFKIYSTWQTYFREGYLRIYNGSDKIILVCEVDDVIRTYGERFYVYTPRLSGPLSARHITYVDKHGQETPKQGAWPLQDFTETVVMYVLIDIGVAGYDFGPEYRIYNPADNFKE